MADEDWDDAPAKAVDVLGAMEPEAGDLPEIKLFGKWSCDEVNVSDMSLQVGYAIVINRKQSDSTLVGSFINILTIF